MSIRFAVVAWLDAWGDSHNEANEETVIDNHGPKPMETSGWVLRDDEKGISIFTERSLEDNVYRGRTFIPRVMISQVTDVDLRPRKRPNRSTRSKTTPRPSDPAPVISTQGQGQAVPQDPTRTESPLPAPKKGSEA